MNNSFVNQLNLTPQERRIMVIIFLVVIFVLNLLFVWPHFGEWSKMNRQLEDMRAAIAKDNAFIKKDLNPTNGFKVLVLKYSQMEGTHVEEHAVDPQIQLGKTIRAQEHKTGVYVQQFNPGSVNTNNAFFEEISTAITVQSQEPQLISFLYNMGMDPAMIRVARLDLQPADANRYALKGTITLTANYAKRAPTAAAAPAAPTRPVHETRPGPAVPSNKPFAHPPPAQAGAHPRPGPNMPGANRPGERMRKEFPNLPKRPSPFPNPNHPLGKPGTAQQ